MTYVVHGATGAQGSPVLKAFRAAGLPVTAAVRDVSRVPEAVTAVAVDLEDAAALRSLYSRAEGVFLHLPMGPEDVTARRASAIAKAIRQAHPPRVVISTSGVVVDEPGSPLQAADDHPLREVIWAAQTVSAAVITPRLFLENLLLPVIATPVESDGMLRYPLPPDYRVSWCCHDDVAQAALRLMTSPQQTGTVAVGQLPGLTGQELAAAWGAHLGRAVAYEQLTPEQFGELLAPLFGSAAQPVVKLYTLLNQQPSHTINLEVSAQRLLGLELSGIRAWLSRVS